MSINKNVEDEVILKSFCLLSSNAFQRVFERAGTGKLSTLLPEEARDWHR